LGQKREKIESLAHQQKGETGYGGKNFTPAPCLLTSNTEQGPENNTQGMGYETRGGVSTRISQAEIGKRGGGRYRPVTMEDWNGRSQSHGVLPATRGGRKEKRRRQGVSPGLQAISRKTRWGQKI